MEEVEYLNISVPIYPTANNLKNESKTAENNSISTN